MSSACLCARVRVVDGDSPRLRVSGPGEVRLGIDQHVPVRPVITEYAGPYEVTPDGDEHVLATEGLAMTDDVTVHAVPLETVARTVSASGTSAITPDTDYYGIGEVDLTVPEGKVIMRRPTLDEAAGEVRSRADVTAGYVAPGGGYSGSALILDKQAAATITPTESEQVAVAQYRWTTGEVKVAAIPPEYVVPSGTYSVTASGTYDVTQYASASVAAATPTNDSDSEYITSSGVRKWRYRPKTIVPTAGWAAQRSASNPINGFWQTFDAIPTGTTVTPTTSAQTVGGADTMLEGAVTVSAVPTGTEGTPSASKTVSGHTATVTPSVTNVAGYIDGGTHAGAAVTVAASELVSGTKGISANGTGIDVTEYAAVDVSVPTGTARTSADLTVSGATVTAPAGLYDEAASATVPSGTATMPASATGTGTIVGALNNTMNVQGTITATPQVSAGYVSSGTSGSTSVSLQTSVTTLNATTYSPQASDRTIAAGTYTIGTQTIKGAPLQSKSVTTNGTVTPDDGYYGLSSVDVSVSGGSPNLQAKTRSYTPSETAQSETVACDAGYDGLASVDVSVGAISSTYVGSGITRRDSSSLSESGATVSVPAGYYENAASKAVSSGSATASATKGAVNNHSVTVTPSVTRTAGYVTAGTSNGTAVTVSASELVSGSETKTANGTYDVTNLAELVVSVSGGSSVKTATGTFTGNGTRTIDVACTFEPDIVYFTSNPGTTASSGTVAAIIVRDMMTATRYRNNSTTNSHYAIPDIAGLNTSGSSYSWRATYANSKVTLYCFSNNARSLLTNGRTYTYTFVKWT